MLPNSTTTRPCARAHRRPVLHAVFACAALTACDNPDAVRPDTAPFIHPITSAPERLTAIAPAATPSMLDEYLGRPPQTREQWEAESRTWVLPTKTKRLDAVLFIGIAQADLAAIEQVLTPDATWGAPDLHMTHARPVFGPEGPDEFLLALQATALRFPPKPNSLPTAVPDGIASTFATGAEPMWTVLQAPGEGPVQDRIVMRKVVYRGQPRIDYVGFWPDGPPSQPESLHAGDPPPPLRPPIDRTSLPTTPAAVADDSAE